MSHVVLISLNIFANDSSAQEPQTDQLKNQVRNQSLMTTKTLKDPLMETKELDTEEAKVA